MVVKGIGYLALKFCNYSYQKESICVIPKPRGLECESYEGALLKPPPAAAACLTIISFDY
jgi:hypothetical protein